ncbi:MAG: hypothetical protein U1F39_06985 [Steroidobacteraceae bacterium]
MNRAAHLAAMLLIITSGMAIRADVQAAGAGALPPQPPGALSKENLNKKRPKPPFDLTGNWMWNTQRNRDTGGAQFFPLPKFKPAVKAVYDEAMATIAAGKAYKNDEGYCWPAGMPESMTRVWPNQTIQLPTMIMMVQMLKHEIRWIYIDGRPHADPEIKPPSYSGDSIGHYEGDTLVVDTTNLQTRHHWIQNGVPVGEKLRIIERIKLLDGGNTLQNTITMIDPDSWEGEWTSTKYWYRDDSVDAEEAFCLPDINDNLLSTRESSQVK